MSHDSVSRWLGSQHIRPHELWQQVSKGPVNTDNRCLLVVDDTLADKRYSKKIDIVSRQYSGNEHSVIPGIGIVNLLWLEKESGDYCPIDYRIYDKKSDGKTKNNHCREMLKLAKERGIKPDVVVFDSWYCSKGNLIAIRDFGWDWVAFLKKNRKINKTFRVDQVEIPEDGLKVHLRGYGWCMLFRFEAKNGRIDYVATNIEGANREQVYQVIKQRWSVEVYHRELKQTCGIERCQAHTGRAQRNHIALSIKAWVQTHIQCTKELISHYQYKWEFIKDSAESGMKRILAFP